MNVVVGKKGESDGGFGMKDELIGGDDVVRGSWEIYVYSGADDWDVVTL